MKFSVKESGLNVEFLVRDNGVVELNHFAPEGAALTEKEIIPKNYHEILAVQETGKSTREIHGYKHNLSSASLDYK